jgi:transcriptional regulator with XRE-family HTH domain
MARIAAEVGHRLRVTREALGLSQKTFAARIDVQQTTWSQYEGGHRILPIKVAEQICSKYNCDMNWLYAGDHSNLPRDLRAAIVALLQLR